MYIEKRLSVIEVVTYFVKLEHCGGDQKMIKKLFLAALCLIKFGLAQSADDSQRSVLYQAHPIKIANLEPGLDYLTEHLLLATKASTQEASKNIGAYSITYVFCAQDDSQHIKTYKQDEIFTEGGFDQTKDSMQDREYRMLLVQMKRFTPVSASNDICNINATLLDDAKSHVSGRLHHSENRIMLDCQYYIARSLLELMQAEKPKEILGLAVNIHSTNDVCNICGPRIERFLQIMKTDFIEDFNQNKSASLNSTSTNRSNVDPFKNCTLNSSNFVFFASISSSSEYGTAYIKREKLAHNKDYFSKCFGNRGRYDSYLDGVALYSWIPSLRGIDLSLLPQESGFSVTLHNSENFLNFHQLVDVVRHQNCLKKIEELVVLPGTELSTEADNKSLNLLEICKLTELKTLNLSGTLARASLHAMVQHLKQLVKLNINKVIADYTDAQSPASKLELLKIISELPALEELSAESNQMKTEELLVWFQKRDSKIKVLNFAHNLFFQTPLDAATINIVQEFTITRTVDLSDNGNAPEGLQNISNLTLDNSNAQNLQQVTPQPRTLADLSEKEWNIMKDSNSIPRQTITKVQNNQVDYQKGSQSYIKVEALAKNLSFLCKTH